MRKPLRLLEGCALASSILLLTIPSTFSQSSSAGTELPANDLVRMVVANEQRTAANDSYWMYHVTREEQGKKTERDVIQTAQGSLDRLTSIDGHSLSASQEAQEANRIQNFVSNSAEQRRAEESTKKDAEQCKEAAGVVATGGLSVRRA
jgi:hypothetical protein